MKTQLEQYIEYRRAKSQDVGDMVCIDSTCFSRNNWTIGDFDKIVGHKEFVVNVASVGATIVGYVVIKKGKKSLLLASVAVEPGMQRNGIGRKLVASAVDIALKNRMRSIYTSVPEVNLDAQLFFRECGYKATGAIVEKPDSGTCYTMKFSLKE